MKFSFKHALASAAFVATAGAQAQTIPFPQLLSSGSGTLAFSSDGHAATAAAGIALAAPAVIPVVAGVSAGGGANAASYAPNVLGLNFSSVTVTGDHVTGLASPDSFLRLRRAILDDNGEVITRESVYLTGFEFDLNQSTIYANVFAATNDAAATSFGRTAIFTASQAGIVGGTEGRVVIGNGADGLPRPTASGSFAGSLRLTDGAGTLILSNLGLGSLANNPTHPLNRLWREADWGTVSFTAPAVPEPSTYAMFGIGLLVAGALARRRQATA